MAKSVQNYIDELYSQGKTEADRLKEQRTQADDKLIQQTNAAIDKAAAASAKPYQTQLDELPALYGKLYDANAVQELVNRRQGQETMANMGLTDSGLNRILWVLDIHPLSIHIDITAVPPVSTKDSPGCLRPSSSHET